MKDKSLFIALGLMFGAALPAAAANMSDMVTSHKSDVRQALLRCQDANASGLPIEEQASKCLENIQEIRDVRDSSRGEFGHAPTERWADAFADQKAGAIYMMIALNYLNAGGGTLAADSCEHVLLAQQGFTQISMDEAREKEWFGEDDYALMDTAGRVAEKCIETFPNLGS